MNYNTQPTTNGIRGGRFRIDGVDWVCPIQHWQLSNINTRLAPSLLWPSTTCERHKLTKQRKNKLWLARDSIWSPNKKTYKKVTKGASSNAARTTATNHSLTSPRELLSSRNKNRWKYFPPPKKNQKNKIAHSQLWDGFWVLYGIQCENQIGFQMGYS